LNQRPTETIGFINVFQGRRHATRGRRHAAAAGKNTNGKLRNRAKDMSDSGAAARGNGTWHPRKNTPCRGGGSRQKQVETAKIQNTKTGGNCGNTNGELRNRANHPLSSAPLSNAQGSSASLTLPIEEATSIITKLIFAVFRSTAPRGEVLPFQMLGLAKLI